MEKSNFVDQIKIFCRSGHGGAGSKHFMRNKLTAKGGPDGGDGGRGAHIILKGNSQLWTLLHLRYYKNVLAEDGEDGSKNNSSGKTGKDIIIEKEWNEIVQLEDGFSVRVTPARHFSGRTFKRDTVLWVSFVLQTPHHKIFIGGDGGYDTHFKKIGEEYGPFDLAILECGQYNEWWPYIHMMPEETVLAAIDLKAKLLMPVHWGKFALGLHPWDEPVKRAVAKADELNVKWTTPMIGEPVVLDESIPAKQWWLSW